VKDLETKLSKREIVEVPDTPTAGNEQEEGASILGVVSASLLSIFLLFVDACLASSSFSSDDVARTMSTRVSDLEVDAPSSCCFGCKF
jgi:hypothetical protein